jgi:hypothetical protein
VIGNRLLAGLSKNVPYVAGLLKLPPQVRQRFLQVLRELTSRPSFVEDRQHLLELAAGALQDRLETPLTSQRFQPGRQPQVIVRDAAFPCAVIQYFHHIPRAAVLDEPPVTPRYSAD